MRSRVFLCVVQLRTQGQLVRVCFVERWALGYALARLRPVGGELVGVPRARA